MALALPYTIVNGDPVDANPVQSNYRMIETYTNQEVIDRAGTVAMNAQLKLVGNPVAPLDAAPKQYVDQQLPIGVVMMYGGTVAPPGGIWLLCDGTEYQSTTYPELAAVMGATAGRFNVPSLVDRLPVGGGAAYAHHSTGGSADAALPQHGHAIDHGHADTGLVSNDHSHHISFMSGASDRPLGTSPSGDHVHGEVSGQAFVTSGGPSEIAFGAGFGIQTPSTTGGGGNHTHSVTDHLHPINGDTGGISANHSHTVPVMVGASGQAGVAPTGLNLPPYYAIAFIIKAR